MHACFWAWCPCSDAELHIAVRVAQQCLIFETTSHASNLWYENQALGLASVQVDALADLKHRIAVEHAAQCNACKGRPKHLLWQVARALGPGHTIVTVLCDGGHRHLSRFHSPEYLASVGLAPQHRTNDLSFVA